MHPTPPRLSPHIRTQRDNTIVPHKGLSLLPAHAHTHTWPRSLVRHAMLLRGARCIEAQGKPLATNEQTETGRSVQSPPLPNPVIIIITIILLLQLLISATPTAARAHKAAQQLV
ncbi:hypothetical protein ACJQWK_11366 [Exserohilum turcicum]